jgi:hypothetical protein
MYPHERSLVEKFKDRPFVILGVNSDDDRDQLKQVIAKEKLTWRSFWDGGSTDGPISRRWNINGWPTLYLIDHTGTIVRNVYKDEDLIEQKVKEAEQAAKKRRPGPVASWLH